MYKLINQLNKYHFLNIKKGGNFDFRNPNTGSILTRRDRMIGMNRLNEEKSFFQSLITNDASINNPAMTPTHTAI